MPFEVLSQRPDLRVGAGQKLFNDPSYSGSWDPFPSVQGPFENTNEVSVFVFDDHSLKIYGRSLILALVYGVGIKFFCWGVFSKIY